MRASKNMVSIFVFLNIIECGCFCEMIQSVYVLWFCWCVVLSCVALSFMVLLCLGIAV